VSELAVAAGVPAQREERLVFGPRAVDDVDQAIAVDVHHAHLMPVRLEVDLRILRRRRGDLTSDPVPHEPGALRRVNGVLLDARHVKQVHDAVAVDVLRGHVRVVEAEHVRVDARLSRHDVHRLRLHECVRRATEPVEIEAMLAAVVRDVGREHVGQTVGVYVEELRVPRLQRLGRAAGHR
jgi:hypothetical protein